MNTLLTREEAEDLLRPHLPRLGRCLREAIDRFTRERAKAGPVSTRTRASHVHDFAAEIAEREFAGVAGVAIVYKNGFPVIIIDQRVLVRFKKLTPRLATCGIPTGQARLWHAQEQLPGLPPFTHLVAGYVLDDLGAIERLLLVCSLNQRPIWTLPLEAAEGAQPATLIPLRPVGDPGHAAAVVRSTLKPEEADKADDDR